MRLLKKILKLTRFTEVRFKMINAEQFMHSMHDLFTGQYEIFLLEH